MTVSQALTAKKKRDILKTKLYSKRSIFATILLGTVILFFTTIAYYQITTYTEKQCSIALQEEARSTDSRFTKLFSFTRRSLAAASTMVLQNKNEISRFDINFVNSFLIGEAEFPIRLFLPDGTAVYDETGRQDVSDKLLYPIISGQSRAVSKLHKDIFNPGSYSLCMAQVVQRDGQDVGVIEAVISSEKLLAALDTEAYEGAATFFIVDRRDSQVILSSGAQNPGDHLTDIINEMQINKMMQISLYTAIMNGESGFAKTEERNNQLAQYVYYLPTTEENFSIIVSAPWKLVFSNAHRIRIAFLIMTIFEILAFAIYIYCLLKDMRRIIKRETENLQLALSLNRERQTLQLVHDVIDSALWSMDISPDGKPGPNFYWSEEFASFLYTDIPNTMDEAYRIWMSRIHPDDRNKIDEAFQAMIADETGKTTFDVEHRMLTEDGSIRWVHGLGKAGFNSKGKIFVIYGSLNDISDRYRLEAALLKADAANEAKTTFLFNMSHDIRTPMNAIMGFTDLAMRNVYTPEKVLTYLSKAQTASNHLLALINDILDMSRIESGKMELNEDLIDLDCFGDAIIPMITDLAEEKDITFTFSTEDIQDNTVYLDRLHLNQAIINLASNAIKYTEPGGHVSLTITQDGPAENGWAYYSFAVADDGIGMTEEFQKQAFDLFTRADSSTVTQQQGSGLGLAITKKITELLDGTISVESELGKGSTFTITIPLRLVDESDMAEHSPDAMEEKASKLDNVNLNGKHILLVEDNEFNREISKEILESAGLVVDLAENGLVAVNMIREKGPDWFDCVLMDIQMPVMDGFEATTEIRRIPAEKYLPIIALSANAFAEDKKKALDAGMDAHHPKPIIIAQLLLLIKELLLRYRN